MGASGPLPKRSAERTRRNTTGEDGIEVKRGVALPYTWTAPSEDWPVFITEYYNSFQESGMQAYFQQTDVAQLWMACQLLAEEWEKPRRSAMVMAEAFKLLQGLGATEGERRRIKVELETPKVQEVDAKVVAMESARERLQNSAKQ